MIYDNLSAHESPVVHRGLVAYPRVQLHFTPTYSSWINQVERWYAELERRCLGRGVLCSLDDLATTAHRSRRPGGRSGAGGGFLAVLGAAELFVEAQGFLELVFEDDDAAGGFDGGALVDEVAGAHGDA